MRRGQDGGDHDVRGAPQPPASPGGDADGVDDRGGGVHAAVRVDAERGRRQPDGGVQLPGARRAAVLLQRRHHLGVGAVPHRDAGPHAAATGSRLRLRLRVRAAAGVGAGAGTGDGDGALPAPGRARRRRGPADAAYDAAVRAEAVRPLLQGPRRAGGRGGRHSQRGGRDRVRPQLHRDARGGDQVVHRQQRQRQQWRRREQRDDRAAAGGGEQRRRQQQRRQGRGARELT